MRDSPLSESLWFDPGRTLARPGSFHVLRLRSRRPWRYEVTGTATLASREHARALSYGKMEVEPPRNGIVPISGSTATTGERGDALTGSRADNRKGGVLTPPFSFYGTIALYRLLYESIES